MIDPNPVATIGNSDITGLSVDSTGQRGFDESPLGFQGFHRNDW
jgi:hypothetical protein